jgi:hypothetical protein
MKLQFDDDLVEDAVLMAADGGVSTVSSLQIRRFHRERERLYSVLDPDERNAAFSRFHLEWFREWGFEDAVTQPVREMPILAQALDALAFRKHRTKSDEGGELYVNDVGQRTGVIAIRPDRLRHDPGAFLRHELMHLQDMVDPNYGYERELPVAGFSVNQQRLARERYRVLWDVSIGGRLARLGQSTLSKKEQRWTEFDSIFLGWTAEHRRDVFESCWSEPWPTHRQLADWACHHVQPANETAAPGSPCPLCGFPTFAWAVAVPDNAAGGEAWIRVAQRDFPSWRPEHGACRRCAEVYRVASALTATVV